MSESALAALVASLGAKQLGQGLAQEVDEMKQQAQMSVQAEHDAKAAAKVEDIAAVPSELLDDSDIDAQAEAHWKRHSEGARAKPIKDRCGMSSVAAVACVRFVLPCIRAVQHPAPAMRVCCSSA